MTGWWPRECAMNAEMFALYIETQPVPTLRPGDVVIMDNLSSHKSSGAATSLRGMGAWFLFLPHYSRDLNPIEMAEIPDPKGSRTNLRSAMESRRTGLQPLLGRGVRPLLQSGRI